MTVNILIADDEMSMRYNLKFAVERVAPSKDNVFFFAQDYNTALEQIKSNTINIAFPDINMPGKTGLELAQAVKGYGPGINMIMVTAHREYALGDFSAVSSTVSTGFIALIIGAVVLIAVICFILIYKKKKANLSK